MVDVLPAGPGETVEDFPWLAAKAANQKILSIQNFLKNKSSLSKKHFISDVIF